MPNADGVDKLQFMADVVKTWISSSPHFSVINPISMPKFRNGIISDLI